MDENRQSIVGNHLNYSHPWNISEVDWNYWDSNILISLHFKTRKLNIQMKCKQSSAVSLHDPWYYISRDDSQSTTTSIILFSFLFLFYSFNIHVFLPFLNDICYTFCYVFDLIWFNLVWFDFVHFNHHSKDQIFCLFLIEWKLQNSYFKIPSSFVEQRSSKLMILFCLFFNFFFRVYVCLKLWSLQHC